MFVIDKRIGISYCVEIDIENGSCCISPKDIEYWLTPFFSVQKENSDIFKICSRIKTKRNIQQNYIYHNNIFYVNSNMTYTKLLYTIMSIIRMVYKYIAFLMGYHNLHGACLKYMDKGILIVAERNQGKTTMILNAIQDKDFLLLANDQVMYSANGENQLLGYPAAIGVRKNSCDYEKQKQIDKKALWFIDDPFQDQLKPVIHIKDLSEIYHCDIVENVKLDIIICYEKSWDRDELVIEDMGRVVYPMSEIELPFEKTYKKELFESCRCSVQYYINNLCNRQEKEQQYSRICIRRINIKCGIDRIRDMLCEIKKMLEEK